MRAWLLALALAGCTRATTAPPATATATLESIDRFADAFAVARGHRRLLALVSPT